MGRVTAPDFEDGSSHMMTPEMLLADLQRPEEESDFETEQADETHADKLNGSPPPDYSHIQNERTSFTADSPYFNSFCEKEIVSLTIMSDALKEISSRTKSYVQTGVMMVEATRQLASSCRLRRELGMDADDEERTEEEAAFQQRKQAVGEEMVTLLGLLSNVSLLPKNCNSFC
jgi:hypothetical protein